MATDSTPLAQQWHENNLDEFRVSANGSRNNNLNEQAIKSFGLALGNQELSIATVEDDYKSAAKALQMADSEVVATLRSALDGASPRPIDNNSSNTSNGQVTPVKTNMALAPVYTALEDYALAHGVPGTELDRHGWEEGVYPYGKYKGVACFIIPHEDGIKRARIKNPDEADGKKWLPIKPDGMKEKITPCWYKFKDAVSMAAASKHKTIILCNGQPSAITAQHYKLPALAQTDGENKKITTPLLKRLLTAVSEHALTVLLAYDGDDTGRAATKLIQKQLQDNKVTIRIVQFGGDGGYDLADYCKEHKTNIMDKLLRLTAYSDKKLQPVLSRSQLADTTHGMITTPKEHIQPGEILIVPFKSFHKLGGFAYLLEPGKTTEVLAPSGGGKTSFLETWQDIWNMWGIDSMFYSPEWSPIQLQHRSIQRCSGINTKVIKLHLLAEKEKSYGIPEEQRHGVEIPKGSPLYNRLLTTNNKLASWPGVSYAFQGQKVTGEILEDMNKKLYELRRSARRIGVAFFDYAQLMKPGYTEDDRNRYEAICGDIKQWCMDNCIHAFIGSQPTKTAGDASRKGDKILDEYDSHWVRPDAFNLVITLNIKEKEIFENGVGTGRMKKETEGIINVCKNNEGEEGQIKLKTNFKHLAWEDMTQ